MAVGLQDESGDQQDSCEVSRKSLVTSRIAVKSLGRVWDQKDSCSVSRTSLVTSSIAVKFQGRVCGPAEWLWSL